MTKAKVVDHPAKAGLQGHLEKITVELNESDWHDYATESVWAKPLGSGHFEIANIPFYLYGVSMHDVVACVSREGLLFFTGIVNRGGHSTYRLFLAEGLSEHAFLSSWQELQILGCQYERATARLIAVDVPANVDIHEVYAVLQRGEGGGLWDFEEGYCGHPLT